MAADQLIHEMDLTVLSPMCRWFDNEHDLETSTNAGEDSKCSDSGVDGILTIDGGDADRRRYER